MTCRLDPAKLAACRRLSSQISAAKMPKTFWQFDQEQGRICHADGQELKMADLHFLKAVLNYFRLIYRLYQTEAQVVIFKAADKNKLDPALPRLDLKDPELVGIIPPQVNSLVNSQIAESLWQKEFAAKGLLPYARVHSHHCFNAYQSKTDFASLQSGSLEIVLGQIQNQGEFCYWLADRTDPTIRQKTFQGQIADLA